MRWYTTALCVLMCSACATSSTTHSANSEVSRSAVIVVAGFYGTKLARIDNGNLLWVTASQAFGGKQPFPVRQILGHGPSLFRRQDDIVQPDAKEARETREGDQANRGAGQALATSSRWA